MNEISLIMALAGVIFAGSLIRSFIFNGRSDKAKEEKPQTKSEKTGEKSISELTMEIKITPELKESIQRIQELNEKILLEYGKMPKALFHDATASEETPTPHGGFPVPDDLTKRWNGNLSDSEEWSIPVRPPHAACNWEDIKEFYPGLREAKYLRLSQLEKGEIIVRILPAAPSGMFERQINPAYTTHRLHYIKQGEAIPCNKVLQKDGTFKGSCSICDEYSNLWRRAEATKCLQGKEKLKTAARNLKPIQRYYFNVMEWDVKSQSYGKPKVLSVSPLLFNIIQKAREEAKKESWRSGDRDLLSSRNLGMDLHIKMVRLDRGFIDYSRSTCVGPSFDLTKKFTDQQLREKFACMYDLCRLHNFRTEDELHEIALSYRRENALKHDHSKKQSTVSTKVEEDFIQRLTKL